MFDLFDVYNDIINEEEIYFENYEMDPELELYTVDGFKKYGSHAITLTVSAIESTDWEVTGKVQEDWYLWINDFYAVEKGSNKVVFGNFETKVFATDEDTYKRFRDQIEVEDWDYHDI